MNKDWKKEIGDKINGIEAYNYQSTTDEILNDIETLLQQEREKIVNDVILELEDYPPDSHEDWVSAMEGIAQHMADKYLSQSDNSKKGEKK